MKISTILGFLIHILLVALLTILTQIGGLVYLLILPFNSLINRSFSKKRIRILTRIASFSLVYLCTTFVILPPMAKQFGRVPLPLTGSLKPLNYGTVLLNRHYVRVELYDLLQDVAEQMDSAYPGTIIAYMDANFPFINGFPLLPHISHSDGRKVDVAFFYKDPQTGQALHRKARNFMGYGAGDGPKGKEIDKPQECTRKGYWQYSLMSRFMPSNSEEEMVLDQSRMKSFVRYLVNDRRTGKILIEPHLKQRLGLSYGKVRFHGCHAVRHDDHLHLQL